MDAIVSLSQSRFSSTDDIPDHFKPRPEFATPAIPPHVIARLGAIGNPDSIKPGHPARRDGTNLVVVLRHHDGSVDPEDPSSPNTGVVGVETSDVLDDPGRRNSLADEVRLHHLGLVVVSLSVVPRHQDDLGLAAAVEIRGNVEASSQIGRRGTRGQDLGTEDNGDVARFSVSDVVNLAI